MKNNVKIREYDTLAFVVFSLFVISLLYFVFNFYSNGREILKVAQTIEYGNDISSINGSKVLGESSVSETNRYYEYIIKLRENKLEKLRYWKREEKTKVLQQYKTFYDLQISKKGDLDYHQIATEIAGIGNKMGIKILGISLGTPRLSGNIKFSGDSRYQIYERPVSIDIAKHSDKGFEEFSVKDYQKLKQFLAEIRNDVKMPFNSGFEVSKQVKSNNKEPEPGALKFDRVDLLFFYNNKK